MTTAADQRAAAVFLSLSNVAADQRLALLEERCGGDSELRREVERLLAALTLADTSLTPPAARGVAEGEVTQPAGAVIGGFVVIRQIGSGGTGVVYLAHQQHPSRIVALKVLRREFVASAVQRRFAIEAELLGQLQHPGIAQIYAAHPGDETTPAFIAMELVNGPPLTEYAESRRLSTAERIELLGRVCEAVQHAHQRGIIHRDLKPGNILVNERGEPKVLDFGVARTAGADIALTTIETEAGQLLGTLAYMSPEQVRAEPDFIDTRTDIHALGVILFRLLTGRLPFGHDRPAMPELARRIAQDNPPRLSAFDPKLRGDLEIIVARALAKEKERRYPSAASLAADLRRYLSGQPIAASADSTWYLLRRQVGRYRLALSLSAAASIALAGLLIDSRVQRARVDRANVEMENQLTTSTLERARLLSVTGNLPIAEELAWRELFRHPDSRRAQWTLWEIYSREPSLWSRAPHEGGTLTVRFSPDDRLLLTTGQLDGFLRLIDVENGRDIRSFAATPKSGTRRAFFTPDGRAIVAGSKDGSIRVWDVQTGALRREIAQSVSSLEDFAIAGGGTQAIAVGPGGTLEVWSLATGQLALDLSTVAPRTSVVAADPAGTLLIAGTPDGVLTAVDLARGSQLWQTRAHQGQVVSVAIQPNAAIVASGGTDSLAHLWNTRTGQRVRTIQTDNGSVRNLTFNRDGSALATAGQWRTQLWDLENPAQPPRSFGGAEGMNDLHLRGDMRFLATCHGAWGLVRLWDLAADSRLDRWPAHGGAVTGLAVGGEPLSVFSGGNDAEIAKWSPGQPARAASLNAQGRVGGLAMSRDGRWIVSVGQAGTATVWDARSGTKIAALPDVIGSRAVLFTDADQQLIIGQADGTLKIWDWLDGTVRNPRRVRSHDSEVLALAAHGSRLFIAHRNTFIAIRDVVDGREIRALQPSASPFSIAVSPDGRLVAAGTWPGVVDLWDLDSGRKLEPLKGPTALVTGLDFSADGRLLALSSRDGSTRLWDVEARQWLATVASRKPGAERVRFLPDGRRLAIGYEDGDVEIRDLQYFFRYAAGQADYQLRLLRAAGESFPRAEDALAWARRMRATM